MTNKNRKTTFQLSVYNTITFTFLSMVAMTTPYRLWLPWSINKKNWNNINKLQKYFPNKFKYIMAFKMSWWYFQTAWQSDILCPFLTQLKEITHLHICILITLDPFSIHRRSVHVSILFSEDQWKSCSFFLGIFCSANFWWL